jgi:hypothetical protein
LDSRRQVSGGDLRPVGGSTVFVHQTVVKVAAHDEQANELTGVERVWRAGARTPSEAVRLVVVAGAVTV